MSKITQVIRVDDINGIVGNQFSFQKNKGNYIHTVGEDRYFVEFSFHHPELTIESENDDIVGCLTRTTIILSMETDNLKYYPLFSTEKPKEMTMAQIEKTLGHKISIINK